MSEVQAQDQIAKQAQVVASFNTLTPKPVATYVEPVEEEDDEDNFDLSSAVEQVMKDYNKGGIGYHSIELAFQPIGDSITGEMDAVLGTVKQHQVEQIIIKLTSLATIKGQTVAGAEIVKVVYNFTSKIDNQGKPRAIDNTTQNNITLFIHVFNNVLMPDKLMLFKDMEYHVGDEKRTLSFVEGTPIPVQFIPMLDDDNNVIPATDDQALCAKWNKVAVQNIDKVLTEIKDARGVAFTKLVPRANPAMGVTKFRALYDLICPMMNGGITIVKTTRGNKDNSKKYANVPNFKSGVFAMPMFSPTALRFNHDTEAVISLSKEEKEAEAQALRDAKDSEEASRVAREDAENAYILAQEAADRAAEEANGVASVDTTVFEQGSQATATPASDVPF